MVRCLMVFRRSVSSDDKSDSLCSVSDANSRVDTQQIPEFRGMSVFACCYIILRVEACLPDGAFTWRWEVPGSWWTSVTPPKKEFQAYQHWVKMVHDVVFNWLCDCFRVIKQSYWQFCVSSTCAHVVFVLSLTKLSCSALLWQCGLTQWADMSELRQWLN